MNRLSRAVLAPSFVVGALLGLAGVTTPEASAAALCEHRSASHLAEHGGRLEDDRWHIARGELPSCDNADSAPTEHQDDDATQPSHDDSQPDKKSRHCRHSWYC